MAFSIMKKHILVIGNDAGRTGAPIVLLHMLFWLKQHKSDEYTFEVLLWQGGALLSDYKTLADTRHWIYPDPPYPNFLKRASRKVANIPYRKFVHEPELEKHIAKTKYDLIYVNTGATVNLLSLAKKYHPKVPVVCHVHELDFILKYHCDPHFKNSTHLIDHFVAVSEQVKNTLVTKYDVSPDIVTVIRPFMPVSNKSVNSKEVAKIKQTLNLPEDAFVAGACGVGGWRKGTDLFLQVAQAAIKKSKNNIHFVWIGFNKGSHDFDTIMFDAQKLGIADRIHLIEKVPNPLDYFSNFDLFVLTSREDPYPLVCLEAASLGKPVICFKESGGIPEFVERGGGFSVPYLDTEAMAVEIARLSDKPEEIKATGEAAKQLVSQEHHVDKAGKEITGIFEEIIKTQ